jgi:hypothetical protein
MHHSAQQLAGVLLFCEQKEMAPACFLWGSIASVSMWLFQLTSRIGFSQIDYIHDY